MIFFFHKIPIYFNLTNRGEKLRPGEHRRRGESSRGRGRPAPYDSRYLHKSCITKAHPHLSRFHEMPWSWLFTLNLNCCLSKSWHCGGNLRRFANDVDPHGSYADTDPLNLMNADPGQWNHQLDFNHLLKVEIFFLSNLYLNLRF